MNLLVSCMDCLKDNNGPAFAPFMAQYYENRIVISECPKGHRSAVLPQSQKFEILLESGANALLEGFTLEGAATYAAALERLFEFSVKVMLVHLGADEETYNKMFKEMARQSERQIGAFLALHVTVLGDSYVPSKKITEFRNAYIHKGQLPDPDEAKEFCSLVYAEIFSITARLNERCVGAIGKVITMDLDERKKAVPDGTSVATAMNSAMFSLGRQENKSTFDEALAAYRGYKKMINFALDEAPKFFSHAMNVPEAAAALTKSRG